MKNLQKEIRSISKIIVYQHTNSSAHRLHICSNPSLPPSVRPQMHEFPRVSQTPPADWCFLPWDQLP